MSLLDFVTRRVWFCLVTLAASTTTTKSLNKFEARDLTTCKDFHVVKIQSAVAKKRNQKRKQAKREFLL